LEDEKVIYVTIDNEELKFKHFKEKISYAYEINILVNEYKALNAP